MDVNREPLFDRSRYFIPIARRVVAWGLFVSVADAEEEIAKDATRLSFAYLLPHGRNVEPLFRRLEARKRRHIGDIRQIPPRIAITKILPAPYGNRIDGLW